MPVEHKAVSFNRAAGSGPVSKGGTSWTFERKCQKILLISTSTFNTMSRNSVPQAYLVAKFVQMFSKKNNTIAS